MDRTNWDRKVPTTRIEADIGGDGVKFQLTVSVHTF